MDTGIGPRGLTEPVTFTITISLPSALIDHRGDVEIVDEATGGPAHNVRCYPISSRRVAPQFDRGPSAFMSG